MRQVGEAFAAQGYQGFAPHRLFMPGARGFAPVPFATPGEPGIAWTQKAFQRVSEASVEHILIKFEATYSHDLKSATKNLRG